MTEPARPDKDFRGVSLPSLLQMLEQERKSCTLTAASGGRQGRFFFEKGRLIDARFEEKVGPEAADELLSMKNPDLMLTGPDDRMQRIHQPLARILLHAAFGADAADRKAEAGTMPHDAAAPNAVHPDLRISALILSIIKIPQVKRYYLLSSGGKAVVQSSANQHLCNFLSYTVMSGLQMRRDLKIKGPRSIQLLMEGGEVLLLMPGAGMIIGLMLDEQPAVPALVQRIRSVLRSLDREVKREA